jgi:hypothetical protein
MTDRTIRDVLAEAMRIERLSLAVKPSWREWAAVDPDGCEAVRRRADHIIRLLASEGVVVVRIDDPSPAAAPTSPDIWRFPVANAGERIIRDAGDAWQIVLASGGHETVQMSFTLAEAHILGGRVLVGDRAVLQEQGATTKLAAALEILRVHAK